MWRLVRQTFIYRRYKELRGAAAAIAYGNPARSLIVIGITGTNGKTTTCMLVQHLLTKLGYKSLVVTTNGAYIGDQLVGGVSKMTSYDPFALQHLLAVAHDEGCTHAVIEVSSHGLDQYRFKSIPFSVGVLTNITPEHLDYHGTVESYALTKRKLFNHLRRSRHTPNVAVLPFDDDWGKKRSNHMQFGTNVQYGLTPACGLRALDIVESKEKTTFQIKYHSKTYKVLSPLVGTFNVRNVLAACGVLFGLGYDTEKTVEHISTFAGVSGRQMREQIDGIDRYIDYAHTPHGLEVMLRHLQTVKGSGHIICVFGAPGERDAFKRPEMGQVADRMADIVIVTDDDAAKENRRDIISDITSGIKRDLGDEYFIVPNRRQAIYLAAQIAQPDDIVLLAGIGHQDVLVTNFGKIPRSEQQEVHEAMASRLNS